MKKRKDCKCIGCGKMCEDGLCGVCDSNLTALETSLAANNIKLQPVEVHINEIHS